MAASLTARAREAPAATPASSIPSSTATPAIHESARPLRERPYMRSTANELRRLRRAKESGRKDKERDGHLDQHTRVGTSAHIHMRCDSELERPSYYTDSRTKEASPKPHVGHTTLESTNSHFSVGFEEHLINLASLHAAHQLCTFGFLTFRNEIQ